MEFFRDTHIDFMKYRRFFITISVVLLVVSVMAVFVHGKLNVGVDFAGGTQLTLKFQEQPEIDQIRGVLQQAGFDDLQMQRFGEEGANEVLIRTPLREGAEEGNQAQVLTALDGRYNAGATGLDLNRAGAAAVADLLRRADPAGVVKPGATEADDPATTYYDGIADAILGVRENVGVFSSWDQVASADGVSDAMLQVLKNGAHLGNYALLGAENVGPAIGRELREKGILAVVLSLIGMLLYIWFRFELRFGVGAVVAVFHDVLVVLGLYALLDLEFNLTTVAAFLTLVGYSVNDTVVIFDRVRENLRLTRREPLLEVINRSINQTLSRTVLTSGTTLLATGALLLWGGDVLRGFAFVLTVGIVVGTYSSVYVASPFAVLWEELVNRRNRSRRSRGESKAA